MLSLLVPPHWASNLAASALPPAVDRHDPTHWRSVLAAMSLTQEQEAELILLLQSHLKQARGFGWGRAGLGGWEERCKQGGVGWGRGRLACG